MERSACSFWVKWRNKGVHFQSHCAYVVRLAVGHECLVGSWIEVVGVHDAAFLGRGDRKWPHACKRVACSMTLLTDGTPGRSPPTRQPFTLQAETTRTDDIAGIEEVDQALVLVV